MKQPWFLGDATSAAHVRLLEGLAKATYIDDSELIRAVRGYPAGFTPEMSELIRVTDWAPLSTVFAAAWFRDGVTPLELDLARNAAGQKVHVNTFTPVIERAQKSPWYADGVDEAEREIINVAFSASVGTQTAAEFFDAVDAGGYTTERVTLPESGEKSILVIGGKTQPAALMAQSMTLFRQMAPEVERVAGPYKPKYFIVQVVNLERCGQAHTSSIGPAEAPGVVKLNPACVNATSTAHELAHVYIGTGPTWFTEGIADLVAMRITKTDGGYFSRRATGLIELETRLELGAPAQLTQGSLGAQFLVKVNDLIGPAAMNAAIRQIAPSRFRTGKAVIDAIVANTPANLKPGVQALIDASIAKSR